MADEKRPIVRSEFDLTKALGMETEAARKYFLLNYFVPLAYNMWEVNNAAFAALHAVPSSYLGLQPVITMVASQEHVRLVPFAGIVGARTMEELVSVPMMQRTFGKLFDKDQMSKFMEHAFSSAIPGKNSTSLAECAVLATLNFTDFGESCILNVMFKDGSKIRKKPALKNQALNRQGTFVLSNNYKRRYNTITGDWADLCPDGDECHKCLKIKNSKAKVNFYDDPEAE